MSVLNGYGKYKRYVRKEEGYQLCSQWTSANTLHFDDGRTAQEKLGAIDGITDSLTATSSNVALSAKAGKSLQDQVNELNTGIAPEIIQSKAVSSNAEPLTLVKTASLDITPGIWLLTAYMEFAASFATIYVHYLINKEGTIFVQARNNMEAGGGDVITYLYKTTSNDTIYNATYQTAENAVGLRANYINAIKLRPL